MAIDPNDHDAIVRDLVSAYRLVINHAIRVRVDDIGEMVITDQGNELVRVYPNGDVAWAQATNDG